MDWLTLGIFGGTWEGFVYRHEEMVTEPNLYNTITMGVLDNIKGAFAPEEPWPLEHRLDIVGVVLTIFAAYKTAKGVKKLLTGSADKSISPKFFVISQKLTLLLLTTPHKSAIIL